MPTASINSYKATEPWSGFKTFVGLDGTLPDGLEVKKCATPTISYDKGKLTFSCETEGVEYVSEVKNDDVKKNYTGEINLTPTYTITVYATKTGYDNSDIATATITWRNGSPTMTGFTSMSLEENETACDVNSDGAVNVADIATIIDKMAGMARMQEQMEE